MSGRFLAIAGIVLTSLLVHADATDPPVGGPAAPYQYSVVLELDEPAGGWSSSETRVRLRTAELLAALGHAEVGGDSPQAFAPLEPGFGSDVYPDWDTLEVVDLDSGTTLTCLDGEGDRQCSSTGLRRGPNLFADSSFVKTKQYRGKIYALADWPLGVTPEGNPRSLRDLDNCPGPEGPSPVMADRGLDCNDLPPGIDGSAPRLAYRDASGNTLDPTPTYTYGFPIESFSSSVMVATPGDSSGGPDPILTIDHNLGQWQTENPSCFLTYEINAQEGATYSVSYKDKTASVGPCGDATSATKIRDDLVATINATFPAVEPIDQPFAIANGETGFDFVFKGAEGFSPPHSVSAGIVVDDQSYCMRSDICTNDAVQLVALMPQLGDAHPSYYAGSNTPIVSPDEHRNIPYLVQLESGIDFIPGMDAGARWSFRTFPYSGFADLCGSSSGRTSYIGEGPAGPGGVDRYQHGFVVGDPHCFRKMDMLGSAWGAGQTRLGNVDLVRFEPWVVLPPSASTTRRVRISWNPANARNEFANLPVVDENLEVIETSDASYDAAESRWVSPHSYTLETPAESLLSLAVTNPRVQLGRESVFPEAVRPRARVGVARNETEALQLYLRASNAQTQVVTGARIEGDATSPSEPLSANGTPAENGTSYFFEYPNLVNARGEPFVGRIVPSFLVRTEAYLSDEAKTLYGNLKNSGQYPDRSSAYLPFTGGNKLTVPGGEAGGLRLLIKPSLDLLPSIEGGVYSGTLQIDLEGEALPVEVSIEIEVFELALPLKPALDRLTGRYRRQALDPAMWHGVAVDETVPRMFSELLLDSLADYRISGFLEGVGTWYEGPSDNYPYRSIPSTVVHDGESRFAVTQKFTPSADDMDDKVWQHEIETYLVPHAGPAQAMDAHGLWQPPTDSSSGRFYAYSLWHNWNALGPTFAPAGTPSLSISGSERCKHDGWCNNPPGEICIGAGTNDVDPGYSTVFGQCTPLWYPVRASINERPWWETVHRAFHKQLAADLRSAGSRDVFSSPQEPYWYIDELRYEGSACAGETMEAYADGYVDAYKLAAPYGWKPMLTLDYSGQYELWRERAVRAQNPETLPPGFEVRFASILWAVEKDLKACEDGDSETPCPYANYDPASPPSLSLSRGQEAGTGFYARHHRITGTAYGAGGDWLGLYMAPSCVEVKPGTDAMIPVTCSSYSAGEDAESSDLGRLAAKHRFENLRDASDDYDYLALLETRQALANAGNLSLATIGAIDEGIALESLAAGEWRFERPIFVAAGATASVTLEATTGSASLHVRANGVPSAESADPSQCDGSASEAGPTATCDVTGPAYAYIAVEAAAGGGAVDATVSILADAPPVASPYADVVARNLAQVAALSSGDDDPFNWLEANKRLTTDMDALQSLRNEIAHSFEVFVPIAGASGGGLANACTDTADCDDHNECTDDICDPIGSALGEGCRHIPQDGTACSDGNACTTNGICQAGSCVSEPLVLDNNYCTFNGFFDGSSCEASSQPMDGIACTTSEGNPSPNSAGVCVEGACFTCEANLSGESCSDCTAVDFPDRWRCLCSATGECEEQASEFATPVDVCIDSDGDGLEDSDEIANGTNHLLADTDGDGLDDGAETGTGAFVDADDTGTDPLNPDTDGDGLFDGAEVGAGMDPHTPDIIAVPTLWPLGTASLVFLMLAGGTLGVLRRR